MHLGQYRVERAMQVRIDDNDLAALRNRFSGLLLRPGDATYDDVRRVHNGMIDRRPALIAQCLGIPDVVDALRFGVAADLEITCAGVATTSPATRSATVD
jgi:hypothetical protein